MASSSFVHLDVRSCFSLKEGAFTPEQLVAQAAALGMPAVALTDRDGLYGAARFVSACQREGVRPILGASLTVRAPTRVGGDDVDAHVVLLANDDTGYANLCRLLTAAHAETRPKPTEPVPPSLDRHLFAAYNEGLVCLSGCARDGLAVRSRQRFA